MIPSGIVTTSWPRVEAKLRDLGVTFDRWQCDASKIMLGRREDGSFAATVGGIVLSIPRQVGKTFLVGMVIVALCLLFPGLTVIWTAHRTRTATKTFHTLKSMTERAKVKPHMLEPRMANGEQEIRFRNGSVIMFGAREQGFGRGFDKVDIAVFDEAQILSEKGVEDIVPATNQAEMDGGALLFFMGTPPRPTDPGAEFTNRRTAALKGQTEDTVYIEFSADEDAALDDHKQWAKANPSFPSRTPVASMKRMRANLTDEDSFRREALGVWDAEDADVTLAPAAWTQLGDESLDVRNASGLVLALYVAPRHNRASIVAVGVDPALGLPVLELVESRPGASWLMTRAAALASKYGAQIALNSSSAIGSLVPDLDAEYVDVKPAQYAKACPRLVTTVNDRALRHRGEADFLSAVVGLGIKPSGDGFKFVRKGDADITPIEAAAVGLWVVASAEAAPTYDIASSIF